jgi:ABC-type transporter MlaC component
MRLLRLACIAWFCLVGPVWAASPLEYTRATLDQARAIVSSDQTHDAKLAALSVLFRNFLDSDSMGREALGKHWSSLTPPEQKEFLALFGALLEPASRSCSFSRSPTSYTSVKITSTAGRA